MESPHGPSGAMSPRTSLSHDAAFMDKYSRQIGAFGMETMAKLVRLRVLIVGLKGLGVEAAKNLILAGPGLVTLHDDEEVAIEDLGANFFLDQSSVGKPRATCVHQKLQELNKLVRVTLHKGDITEELVRQHNVVLWTHGRREDLTRWDKFCREQDPAIGFIASDIMGVFGYVFTDFGPHFVIKDATGENPITRIVSSISNDKEGVVTLIGADEDGKMHELPDSDHDGWVEISDVQGMVDDEGQSINQCGPFRIRFNTKKVRRSKGGKIEEVDVFDPFSFKIGDTSRYSPYVGGGVITQVKRPVEKSFRSLQECIRQPIPPGEYGLIFSDGAKFGRAEQLHMALQGLWEFQARYGRLPNLRHEEEVQEVINYAKALPGGEDAFKVEELDVDTVKQVAAFAVVEFQPLAAFFGGVVAQEIVKFTGKYTPLYQWLHLDWLEVLPDAPDNVEETTPLGSRYDHLISVYGERFVEKLQSSRTFLVGCGALGCEFLKNFAMLGVACGSEGLITCTDNDRIEVSNLNRQFLFREHNVGQPKSVAATEAVRGMNSDIKVKSLEYFVGPQTENIFDDAFWMSQDFITNALDNVKARLYVDSRCVFYEKPLLESGTLGTKCNVQVIIPHMTQSYADGPKDAADDNIPMCTLRNFPSLIEHCIEWARAQFEDLFVAPPGDAKKFVENPEEFLTEVRQKTFENPNPSLGAAQVSQELNRLKQIKKALSLARGVTFERCVEEAFVLFHSLFRDRILQLIHNFPENHVNSKGEKFWTGAKRFPQAAEFDLSQQEHLDLIIATANLLAVSYGLQPSPEVELVSPSSPWRSHEFVSSILGKLDTPAFIPSSEKIKVDEEEEEEGDGEKGDGVDENEALKDLVKELEQLNLNGLSFEAADFEKDQDLNFHIDFITAAANLRAWNYRIREVPRHRVKLIAGKIIPAIATTTASVCGLVMMELLKLLQKKKLEAYKDSSNNLGLNLYLMQEPAPPEQAKDEYDPIEMTEVRCIPPKFTKWDKTLIEGDLTLREFLDRFKAKTGLSVSLLFHKAAELSSEDSRYAAVSGNMLYDREPWKPELQKLYDSKLDERLVDWIRERYAAVIDVVLPDDARLVQLQVSCIDDNEEPCKVPTIVYRF